MAKPKRELHSESAYAVLLYPDDPLPYFMVGIKSDIEIFRARATAEHCAAKLLIRIPYKVVRVRVQRY